jgi:Spy/CpxP family protein refolding chaperone
MNPTQKRILSATVTGLVVLGGMVSLVAWSGHHRMHDPAEIAAFVTDRVDDALDDLDATPDQRARIHAVKDRMIASVQAARGDHRADHQQRRLGQGVIRHIAVVRTGHRITLHRQHPIEQGHAETRRQRRTHVAL